MSCDWLCMNLPELTSFDAQVKSAQDNMLLPSGYLYPDLDGGIEFSSNFFSSVPTFEVVGRARKCSSTTLAILRLFQIKI